MVEPRLTIENASRLRGVELALPLGDNNGGDAVADEVSERAHLRHEAVHTQQQRYAGHGNRAQGRESSRQSDETAASHGGRALGVEHEHEEDEYLLPESEVRVRCLCDEECGDRQIDGCAVQVERVARRNNEADDGL